MTKENVKETRIWNALNILAILVTAFVALYAGFYVPSAFTEKELQSSPPVTAEVTDVLSPLGDRMKLSLTIDNVSISNLYMSINQITNTGVVPIVPADYYENLAINVNPPWKILTVLNPSANDHHVWKKVNDQQFKVSPELLNPGDTIFCVLVAENTQYEHPTLQQQLNPNPYWSAHILNLRSITVQKKPEAAIAEDPIKLPVTVVLYGSTLIGTVLLIIFFMTIYINLLNDLGYIGGTRWKTFGSVLIVSMISLTASEAMTTYLFPNSYSRLTSGVSHWLNMPWIVLNFVLLVWLTWKAWKGRARAVC